MRAVTFAAEGFEDLAWWVERDRKMALKIIGLIREAQRTPFEGTGKPEPLRHELRGAWSRRIDETHRLVYKADDASIHVLACRYHY